VAQTQENKRTKISTVLDSHRTPGGDDPLLLGMVQCSEAFSAPYYMDVFMYADRSVNINPKDIINTHATVSVRTEDWTKDREQIPSFHFTYQQRKGVFQNFMRQDRFHRRVGRDFNTYAGRIVPAFMIMDQEVRYRIFEKVTVLDVIDTCMKSFKGLNLSSYINDQRVREATKKDPLPTMAHCVQYGESTYNFLSRLMARFSIWYFFDHDGNGLHETMVLGTGQVTSPAFKKCGVYDNFPDPRDLEKQGAIEDWQIVYGLSKVYTPAPRLERTSDFNTVVSTRPPQSSDDDAGVKVESSSDFSNHDIISAADGSEGSGPPPKTTFVQESFPDSTVNADKDTTADAAAAMHVAEGQVFTINAVCKNPSFYAGRRFMFKAGDDNPGDVEYLIARMSFNAYDRDYLYLVSRKGAFGLAALLDDLLVQPGGQFIQQFGSSKQPDFATSMSAAGLQEYTNNYVEAASQTKFGTYFAAGMIGYLTSFMPNVTTVLQDLLPLFLVVVEVVMDVLTAIVDAILVIPFLIGKLFGHNILAPINNAIQDAKVKVEKFLEHLLKPTEIDAYGSSFVAIPGDRGQFGIPFPTARNAQVFGPHLATVIGKDGIKSSSGEIFADKLGRVRVRFPWDRTPWERPLPGQAAPDSGSQDKPQFLIGDNTAWVRVSDAWAGMKFGTQFLPRVGDEVIVSFIDGDPDRPIITGRVYNARGTDTTLPFPNKNDTATISTMEDLQNLAGSQDVMTQSGIRTRVLKQSNDNTKYHLLRFDDDPKHTQTLIRSQGRLDITAFSNRYETIGGDRNLTVGWIDKQHQVAGGDYIAKVYCDYHLHVGDPAGPFNGGHRYELVEKDYDLEVKKETNFKLDGDWSVSVGGKASISADTIVLKAVKSITLIVGNSIIVVQSDGIYNEAPIHYEQCGADGQQAADAVVTPPKDPHQADAG
jgi:uncharacterized protein involved in type VI secretion and phage assembly